MTFVRTVFFTLWLYHLEDLKEVALREYSQQVRVAVREFHLELLVPRLMHARINHDSLLHF